MTTVLCHTINDSLVHYLGPHLSKGPMPAVFYFSLSGHDSLSLDPFNQPAIFLEKYPLRIFSMTIPGHEDGLLKEHAMEYWAEKISHHEDIITPFVKKVANVIKELISTHIIEESQLALAGLSRGGYIATLLAAHVPQIKAVLGYAPLIQLEMLQEFSKCEHVVMPQLNLLQHVPNLMHPAIRYYIGNRDVRVGTHHAFHLISKLADYAYEKRLRQASFELIIGNSIGYQGHGTSPDVFKAGIEWLVQKLL